MNYLQWIILIAAAWSIFWKGIALWRAAQFKQKYCFAVMLFPLNDLGILEFIYLFFFSEKKLRLTEIKNWLRS